MEKKKFFWKAWGLAVDAVMVPKGVVMFERKGKVQKGYPGTFLHFWSAGMYPHACPER